MTEPRLSQSIHFLVDRPTREAVMGLAIITAEQAGPHVRPREGDSFRALLEASLNKIKDDAPALYADAVQRGKEELARRSQLQNVG